jgi:hypothetical protein
VANTDLQKRNIHVRSKAGTLWPDATLGDPRPQTSTVDSFRRPAFLDGALAGGAIRGSHPSAILAALLEAATAAYAPAIIDWGHLFETTAGTGWGQGHGQNYRTETALE